MTSVGLSSKETFLKTWNFFRDNSGIFIVQFYNMVHGLLPFKFLELTYRSTEWQLPTFYATFLCAPVYLQAHLVDSV